jgi:DNA cross-link repair 1C protein
MPPGTPYNSFVLPYRIRVDDFGQSTTQDCAAALHLLSHTHTDHINGLSAQSFGYTVICSNDAKEMLLRHEVYAERELHELDLRAEKTRTFSHLKVDPRTQPDGTMYYAGSRDLLVSSSRFSRNRVLTSFRCRKRFPWIPQSSRSFQTVNL